MSSEETVVAKECLDNANETATTHFNEAENGEDEIADTVVLEDEEPIPSRRGSHSSKQPYAASKVLQRVRRGYATAIGRCFMTAQALAQAVRVGKSYKPIKKPNGPTEGTELWEDNYKLLLQSDLTDKKDLYARIKRSFLPTHPLSLSYFESRVKRPRRKLKLMLLGDSLVCGLGCDNDDEGPVMPYIIAKCMSLQYEADVSWNSYGLNAATVAMLRTLLPKVQEGYNSRKDDEEVILLIICGLNDWKTLLEKFPHGSGPIGFRKNLQTLLGELRVFLGQKCRVFLAGVPISCTALDPKARYIQYNHLNF